VCIKVNMNSLFVLILSVLIVAQAAIGMEDHVNETSGFKFKLSAAMCTGGCLGILSSLLFFRIF
jgi:hypothetical protein